MLFRWPHTNRSEDSITPAGILQKITCAWKVMAPGTGGSLTERTRLEDSYLPTVKPQLQQSDRVVRGRRTGTDQ